MIVHCIEIFGSAYLGFLPFSKKRIRAGWSKSAFCSCAFLGICAGSLRLAEDVNWMKLTGDAAQLFHAYAYMAEGVILGLLLALIFSGQLKGTKAGAEPAAAR